MSTFKVNPSNFLAPPFHETNVVDESVNNEQLLRASGAMTCPWARNRPPEQRKELCPRPFSFERGYTRGRTPLSITWQPFKPSRVSIEMIASEQRFSTANLQILSATTSPREMCEFLAKGSFRVSNARGDTPTRKYLKRPEHWLAGVFLSSAELSIDWVRRRI